MKSLVRSLMFFGFLISGSLFIGCNSAPPPMPGPVDIAGKVSGADGAPLKNVAIAFQPTENGHPGEFEVNEKGEFSGQLAQGKFVYFVVPSKKTKSPDALQKVPAAYHSPTMEHIVDVKQGTPIEIKIQ